jgi:hypothetical protein
MAPLTKENCVKLTKFVANEIHGSGFDDLPVVSHLDKSSLIRRGFHVVDENGFCVGWVRFKLQFFVGKDPLDFIINLADPESRRLDSKYLVKAYIENSVAMTVNRWMTPTVNWEE